MWEGAAKFLASIFGSTARLFAWFVLVVIIPITTKFIQLESKVEMLQTAQAKADDKLLRLRQGEDEKDTRITSQLQKIIEDLGIVKGELKRIK